MKELLEKYSIHASLLQKYCIPSMGEYSQPGSYLCEILQRLDENHSLNEDDKKWIKNKGLFQFLKFIEEWEYSGKADFRPLEKDKIYEEIADLEYKYGFHIRSPKSVLYKILKQETGVDLYFNLVLERGKVV